MMVSKRNLLFQGLLFRFHVKFQGCKLVRFVRWLEKNTNIFHQMVLKNNDESHGRSRKKSPTTQTKEERSLAILHVFANPYATRRKIGLIGFHLPT